jgi:hypothetical protein
MLEFLKRYKSPFIKRKKIRIDSSIDAFKPRARYELALFSTLLFLLAALVFQFLITFQTRLLLKFYSISFIYNLFGIQFTSVDASVWPEDRIFLVYGFGYLIYSGLGLLLFIVLKKVKRIHWKLRLFFSWLAFLMVYSIPIGMLSGVFIFDGFGYAYSWIFGNMFIRGFIALIILAVSIYNRKEWIKLFLRSAYSASLIAKGNRRKVYIRLSFIYPWVFGTSILSVFALWNQAWAWEANSIGLGLIVLPIFEKTITKRNLKIFRNSKRIFRFPCPSLQFGLIIVLLWIANYFSKTNF